MAADPHVAPAVNVLAIVLVGPLLAYIGWTRSQKEWPYFIVYAIGILTLLFFAWLLGRDAIAKKLSENTVKTGIFVAHLIFVAPLLLYVGVLAIHFQGHADIPPIIYTTLFIVGVSELIFNTFILMRQITLDLRVRKTLQPGV